MIVPSCFSQVTWGKTFRLETNAKVLWRGTKEEDSIKKMKEDGEGVVSDIMPLYCVSNSELVLSAKQPTNDSDEMRMELEATFIQAFLPHFRFILWPEITMSKHFSSF